VGAPDWRTTYLVLAVLLAVVTIPLHALLLRPPWPAATAASESHHAAVGTILRTPAFRMLAVSFGVGSFAAFAVVFNFADRHLVVGTVGRGSLEGRPVATAKTLRRLTVATLLLASVALVLLSSRIPREPSRVRADLQILHRVDRQIFGAARPQRPWWDP
jgi:hypothetical protein